MTDKPEPWAGYSALKPTQRINRLKRKVEHAQERGDQAYAQALTAAVAMYEQGDGDTGVNRTAHELHGVVRGWQRS